MRNLACTLIRAPLTAVSLAALGVLGMSPSFASAAQTAEGPAISAPATLTLKRLPAGRDELVFQGENSTRTWQVYLSRTEASRISSLQLGLLNAVVVLPERSSMRVAINGRPLAALPVHSPNNIGKFALKIPPGVLSAGFNRIQISVALAHRVDCSVKATYELWASLDPAQTGFALDNGTGDAIRSLDEVTAEPTAQDGATHIHVRLPDSPDPELVARAGRFVNALVRRAGLSRPLVDVGPEPGRGTGFDIVLTPGSPAEVGREDLRILAHGERVTLGRDSATNRLVLVMSGSDETDLDTQISALETVAPSAGLALITRENLAFEGAFRRSFGELGLSTDGFAGRRYFSSVNVTLPADFYPASQDKSRMFIDGGHSATLDKDGELIFRVNGSIAATVTLAAGKAERFEHMPVELPLRLFRPGQNDVSVEGIASSALDRQCDLATLPRESRLTIASTSEFDFPQFARLKTLPQIPAAMAASARSEQDGQTHLYLPNLDRNSIGVALSVLANIAAASGPIETPVVHLESPTPSDVPGIVIASYDKLPAYLSAALREVATPPAPSAQSDAASSDPNAAEAPAVEDGTAVVPDEGSTPGLSALLDVGKSLSQAGAFLLPTAGADAAPMPLPARFLLVGAINPVPNASSIGGIRLPQFVSDASQWLVVTAPNEADYKAGIERLVADGQWRALVGKAISLDVESGKLQSVQPTRVAYVVPDHLILSDIRPILGGILSDNIALSLFGLLLLMSILGLSTHALVRRMGAR